MSREEALIKIQNVMNGQPVNASPRRDEALTKIQRILQNQHIAEYTASQAPRMEAEAAAESDGGILDTAKSVGGGVLGAVGDFFEVGLKEVGRPVMGALSKAVAHQGPLGKALGIELPSGLTEEQKQKILASDSFTEAFHKRFEDEAGWKKFVAEMAGDPLNFVGIGAVAKLRHAGRARNLLRQGGIADRAVGTAQTADELAARAMALPITGTAAAFRKGAQLTGVDTRVANWFAESQKGKYFSGLRKGVSLFQRGGEEEILSGSAGSITRQQTRDITNQLFEEVREEGTNIPIFRARDNAREVMGGLSQHDAVRQWEANRNLLQRDGNIASDLMDRGVIDAQGNVTRAAKFHEELDTTLRSAGWTADERDVLHKVVGFMAEEIPANQTWEKTVFTSSDNVYNNLRVQFGDATSVSREGAVGTITIGRDARPGKVVGDLFENFFVNSLPLQERERIWRVMGRPETARGFTSGFDGFGQMVVDMFRGADLGDSTVLGRIATQLRDVMRFEPQGQTTFPGQAARPEWSTTQAIGPEGSAPFSEGIARPGTVGSDVPGAAPPPLGRASVQDLASDAPFEDYVSRLSAERGIAQEAFEPVREALSPLLAKNADAFQAGYLIDNETFNEALIRAAQDPANMNRHLEDAMNAVDNQFGALWFRNPLIARAAEKARLPHLGRRTRQAEQSKAFGTITDTMLRQQRQDATEILSNVRVQEFVTQWQGWARTVDDGLARIRQEIPIANITDDITFDEVMRDPRIMKRFTPEEREAFDKAWTELGGSRGSLERERRFAKRAQEAWLKGLEKELGITHKQYGRIGREWNNAVRAWKEVTLFTPRYHLANGLDMAIKGLIHGVSGVSAVGGKQSAEAHALRWGRRGMPESLRGDLERRAADMAGFETSESRSAFARYFGGGRYMDDATGEWHEGTRAGRAVGGAISWSREMALGMETSAKAAAWVTGTRRHLEKSVKSRFLTHTSRQARAAGMSEAQTQALVRELRTGGVDFSPEDVRTWVLNNGGSQDLATDISNQWRLGVDEASRYGEELATKVHFQFADERVIEEKLQIRHILPFHTWATRNIPFYIETVAQNPQIIRAMQAYARMTEAEQEEAGLTSRFRDKWQLPDPLNNIASLFLGNGVHAFNPMIAFSIFDQIKGQPYIPEEEVGGPGRIGTAIMQGQRIGFSPAPWIDLPLNILGIYGTREPFGIWRHGDVVAGGVEAATGINIDAKPTVSAVTNLRNRLAPITGVQQVDTVSNSQRMDFDINKKLREFAIREGTGPEDVRYIRAMNEPNSELYKRARAEVVKDNLRRNLHGMISPVPYTRASETEAEMLSYSPDTGGQRLPPEVTAFMREVGHPATAFWGIPDNAVRSQIDSGFAQTRGLSREQRQAVLSGQDLNFFHEYLAWRNTRGEGQDRSVRAFQAQRQRAR